MFFFNRFDVANGIINSELQMKELICNRMTSGRDIYKEQYLIEFCRCLLSDKFVHLKKSINQVYFQQGIAYAS